MADLQYTDRGWPEDYDLILRALAGGFRIGMVPRRLLAWRDRPHGLSRTDGRYSVESFTACKAYHLAQGLLSSTDRYVLWGYGGTGRMMRRALAGHGKTPSHIIEVKLVPHRSANPWRAGRADVVAAVVSGTPIVVVGRARRSTSAEIRQELAAMASSKDGTSSCTA